MGAFLSRALLLVFGYTYPAYECFKAIEKNEPELEQLLFWCQYWVLVAVSTVGERVCDTFVSWVPMYAEAKLAFFVYLWYPKTKGTTYVYQGLLRPYVAKHETEIDYTFLKLRVKAREMGLLFWEQASIYGQTSFFQILMYLSSHSASLSHYKKQEAVAAADGAGDLLTKSPSDHHKLASDLSSSTEASTDNKTEETLMAAPNYPNGNLINSFKLEAVSKEAVTPRSRSKWRFFRATSSR